MCHKNRPTRKKKAATRVTTVVTVVSPKQARKTRTKTRKPKYLSLKLQLSSTHQTQQKLPTTKKKKITMPPKKKQLKLFPLSPENHVQEENKDMQDHHHQDQDDQVAFLFDTATDTTSSTLHGLLDDNTTTTATTASEGGALSSGSQAYYGGGSSLVRAAMRCKERDPSEERWVSYWEVVEKREQEEVSSCGGGCGVVVGEGKGLVGLKLDYEEILNTWCDKGPLYIDGESSSQVVPDLYAASNALLDRLGIVGNLWQVPEMSSMKTKDKVGEKEGWKLRQREASVLRYKEKRQSRLFSKRIRYDVRKLNAEKRPRFKGRFVKRDEEE